MSSSILFPNGSDAGLPALFGGSAPAPSALTAPTAPAPDPLSIPITPSPVDPTFTQASAPDSWAVLGHMAQGKSLPDAYAAAQAQLPTPPPAPAPTNRIGDVLDSLFLDGAFRKTRYDNYAKQVQAYNLQVAREQQARMLGAVGSLPQEKQADALLAPEAFVKNDSQNFAPQTASGGQTVMFGGPNGPRVTAPLLSLDPTSGATITQTPDATTVTGHLGGGYSTDANGNVISSRTGATGTSVPIYEKVGAGETGGYQSQGGSGPPPSAPMLGGSGAAPAAGVRGVRNNNLLNVKSLPNGAQWRGQIGTDSQGYAIFPQGAEGAALSQRAAMRNMASYGRKDGVNTVTQYADRWNPGASSAVRNNYISTLSSALGVGPNDKIDLTDPKVQQTLYQAQIPLESGSVPNAVPTPAQGRFPSSLQGKTYTMNADGTQTAPNGQIAAGPNFYGPEQKQQLYERVAKSDDYQQAQNASIAYKALIGNAQTMTGPSAYAILDTFARAINPGAVARPQVIETIEKNLGPLNHVQGGWSSALGKGNLTPAVRQQVIDAVLPFVQSHWQAANALNQSNVQTAQRHGFDPRDVVAPLDAAPSRFVINQGSQFSRADLESEMRRRGLLK